MKPTTNETQTTQRTWTLGLPALLVLATMAMPTATATEECRLGAGIALACHIEPNGNWVALVETQRGLECQWSTPVSALVPEHHYAYCRVVPDGGGEVLEEGSSNGAASGSILILAGSGSIAVNVAWTMTVVADEVFTENFRAAGTDTITFDSWTAKKKVAANSGIGGKLKSLAFGLTADFDLHKSRTATNWQRIYEDEWSYVEQRQQMVASIENLYVEHITDADLIDVSWSGRTYGCDAPDLVELVLGPRDTDDYTVNVDAEGASGSLAIGLGISRYVMTTDRHEFKDVQAFKHGAQATWGNPTEALVSLLSEETAQFSSPLDFVADYEMPEGPAEGLKSPIGESSDKVPIVIMLNMLLGGKAPTLNPSALALPTDWSYGGQCVPMAGMPSYAETWTAEATAYTVRGQVAGGSSLPVEISMDLDFQGSANQ